MTPHTIASTSAVLNNVIECATARFKDYGYRRTTVGDIAEELHVSKKTIYGVFASKKEILKEAAWRETLSNVRVFSDTLSRESAPDVQLLAFARFIFTDRVKHGAEGRFWGVLSKEEIVRSAYRSCLRRIIAGIYESGRTRGLFRENDSPFAAVMLVSMIVTALEYFPNASNPAAMFNEALTFIAESVEHKHRIPFESMG